MSYFQGIGRMSAYDNNSEKETKGDDCLKKSLLMMALEQGSLLFSKFEFSIKPDLRDLSFL